MSVDVLLPVRSPAPWLEFTLDALVEQSYSTWRLVTVIDGSSDSIEALVRSRVPDAVVVQTGRPTGLVGALNRGLDECTGDYIVRIDADDIPLPHRLQTQRRYMKENPNCAVVGSSIGLIDESGAVVGSRRTSERASVLRRLRWRNPLAHPSTMLRRDAVEQVGRYSAEALLTEDFDLWLRLATVGDVDSIPEVLTLYRIHSQQVTKTQRIGRAAVGRIGRSRLALADSRNESQIAARVRQFAWAMNYAARSSGS